MRRFMLLMHGDTTEAEDGEAWGSYLAGLRASGRFEGGSSLAPVEAHRAAGQKARAASVVGYLIVQADDIDGARAFLDGNPVLAAGGTVEIFELVED